LVDDDPFVLELTTHVLNETNLNVSSFSRVEDAMAAIEKEHFDLLITDVQMPGKNGFELISYFKEKQQQNPHTIAITGESNDKQHYSKAGFSAVVQKPFFPDELITVISGLLKNGEIKMYSVKQQGIRTNNVKYSIEGIKAFAEGEMDTTREILTSFTESTSQNLTMFKKYLQTGDYEEIKKLAHKMLPMFRQLETAEIIEPLQILEQDIDKINEDKCLELGYQLIINIEFLMEKIIEEYQLPFSGKLIS
jgi:DNA-binding response OmpR family regulator